MNLTFHELKTKYKLYCPHCNSIEFIALNYDEDYTRLRLNISKKSSIISSIPCSVEEYSISDQLDSYVNCHFYYCPCNTCNYYYYIVSLFGITSTLESESYSPPDDSFIDSYYGLKPDINVNNETKYIVKTTALNTIKYDLPSQWIACEFNIDSHFNQNHFIGPIRIDDHQSINTCKIINSTEFKINIKSPEMLRATKIADFVKYNVRYMLLRKRVELEIKYNIISEETYNYYIDNINIESKLEAEINKDLIDNIIWKQQILLNS